MPSCFQSQLGSIGARAQAAAAHPASALSIPAWFDWRPPRGPGLARHQRNPFNPSLVRLAPRLGHVAIASYEDLSIPAWFDWRPGPPLPPLPAG